MSSEIPESTPELTPESTSEPNLESNPKSAPKPSTPEPKSSESSFGWTTYAEQLNGRFAMIGIIVLLILEFFSQQTFFEWIGWP